MSERRSIEENKKLCEEMPFLKLKNSDDEDEYYLTELDVAEIPIGWRDMFLEFCRELTPILKKANLLNEFSFAQVKEKWGRLVIYEDIPIPEEISEEYDRLVDKYEKRSISVCFLCGKEGDDVHITNDYGWMAPLCKECRTKRGML